jgi:hypothetical protein
MLPLTIVARIQYAQWGILAIWIFFFHEDFMKKVFDSSPSTGFRHAIERWGFASGAACLTLFNIAAAQFDVEASQRKFLQYFMGGYITLAAHYFYMGTAENNVPVVAFAGLNAILCILAVYVWHKDAKNDYASPDQKLTLACRITYGLQVIGVICNFSGCSWNYLADQTLKEDAANVAVMQLACVFNVFIFMAGAAASQIDSDDQKKFVQYSMLTYLVGFPKLAQWGIEFTDCVNCKLFILTILLLQTQVFLTYGGSCLKTIIRCGYTCCFGATYIGFFNTPRFLKMMVGELPLSKEAGLIMACMSAYLGLIFVAVAQLDAEAHRKVLQYYTVGNILMFLVIHQTDSMTDMPCKWYMVFETCMLVAAIYRKELGLDKCKILCPFAFASCFGDGAESGASSPKRTANKGRSATPAGKSKKKKA